MKELSAIMRWRIAAAAFPLLLVLTAGPTAAQFQVTKRVVASGGTQMGSPGFSVSGTTGQMGTGRLQGVSFSARSGFWFLEDDTATGVDEPPRPAFALEQNYPNPFNPTTEIPFALPRETLVSLRIFDAAGRLVDVLVDEVRPAGVHREMVDASSLSSGIYFYRIEADGNIRTRKFVLLK